jgi:hypothetical protein
VEVAVSDGGGSTVPVASEPTNSSIGGRGLGIVARLSLRWGVCVDGHPAGGRPAGGRSAGDHPNGGGAADGHGGDCPGAGYPGETTVWAELPVRYGCPASLVTASSRDA